MVYSKKPKYWVFFLILVVGIGITWFVASQPLAVVDDDGVQRVLETGCIDDTVTMTTVTLDKYHKNLGNRDVQTEIFKQVDGNWLSVTSSNAQADFSAAPGDTLKILAYDDGQANLDTASDWYGEVKEINVKCEDPFYVTFDLHKEVNLSSIIITNANGEINKISQGQAMTASVPLSMGLQLQA